MKPTLPEPDITPEESFTVGLEDVPYFSAETVQRLIDEAYAAGLEDAKSGLKLSDFEPGKMYESTTHGTVTYRGIDSYMGQHTLEFYSPKYQQKLYVLPENMGRHFKMAKDGS